MATRKTAATKDDREMTPREVAKLLGVDPATVRYWILTRRLPAVRIGSRYRIQESDLHRVRERVA